MVDPIKFRVIEIHLEMIELDPLFVFDGHPLSVDRQAF